MEKRSALLLFAKKWLKMLLAVGLIFWLIQRGYLRPEQLAVIFHPRSFTLCFICVVFNLFFTHWRWVVLLRAQGFANQVWGTLPLSFIGWFFNFVIPGGVGGDLVKAYYIVQDNPRRRVAAATTVVMDRVVGLYAMFIMAITSFFIDMELVMKNGALFSVALLSLAGFGIATLALALALSKSVRQHGATAFVLARIPGRQTLQKIYDAIHEYRNSLGALAAALTLSGISQVVSVFFFSVVGSSLGMELPWSAYFFAVPLGFIVSSVPLAPAGIGVGQVAFLFLFKLYVGGESAAVGPTGVTIFQAMLLLWSLLGAYFYAQRSRPVFEEVSS